MFDFESTFSVMQDYVGKLVGLAAILLILVLALFVAQVGMAYMELHRIADIVKAEGDRAGYFSSQFYNNTVNEYFTERGRPDPLRVTVNPGFNVRPTRVGEIARITLEREAGFRNFSMHLKVHRTVVNRGFFGEGYSEP